MLLNPSGSERRCNQGGSMTRTTPPTPVDADQADADADQADVDSQLAPPAEPGLLAAALAAGAVSLYRVRRSGTLRHLTYLAPGSEAREVAEWYAYRLDEGVTIKGLAAEAGTRPLTVRRALWALDLAEAVEDGDLDGLCDEYDPDESHQFILQVSDFDYPYGETPLTDPENVGGYEVAE
jgi:hypothetical protein